MVDVATFVATPEELPDGVVVLVGHRIVRVVPIHPVAEANRLRGLDGGILEDALLAFFDEGSDAVRFDVPFRLEAELLLHFHLDPQTLAVEAVLIPELMAGHGVEALVEILVSAPPGVVHAHWIVRRNGAVEEGPLRLATILVDELLEALLALPEGEYLFLKGGKVEAFQCTSFATQP